MRDENDTDSVSQSKNRFKLFVEYQAEDKKDAKKVADTLSKKISSLLGTKVKFLVQRDIWNQEDLNYPEEEFWYVTIDTKVKSPF